MAKAPRFSTGFRNDLLDSGMLTDFDSGTLETGPTALTSQIIASSRPSTSGEI